MLRPIPLGLFALLAFATLALDSEQEFRLDRPDAQSVGLVGEFNGWKSEPMSRGNGGTWTITIPLSPGLYGYKFLVNGSEWLIDPQTTLRKQVNGIENFAIEVTVDGEGTALGSSAPPPPLSVESAAPASTQAPRRPACDPGRRDHL